MSSLQKYKKGLSLLLLIFNSIFGYAYDVEVDGIFYNLDTTNKTAVVTRNFPNPYTGDIIIPKQISNYGATYSVIGIEPHAFDYSSITSIDIPNTVTSIGSGAFMYCKELSRLTIPGKIETIEAGLCYNCTSLKTIKLPNSITRIESTAFHGCSALESFSIPENVTYIGLMAFDGCSSLSSITIPQNVTVIVAEAFENCSSLVEVISKIPNPIKLDGSPFTNISPNAVLYVPQGSKSKYENSDWAQYFKEIIEDGETQHNLYISASGNGYVYYNGTTIRNGNNSFTVDEGASATITFTPDAGYQIASVKVGSTDVTSKVTNNKYTISNIMASTNVTVSFEAIPVTTYTLKITASGNGSASYSGSTIRGKTSSFTVNEGTSATITFTPDDGYRIASVKVGNTDVTSRLSDNKYTISSISTNTTVEVVFKEEQSGIDITQYITATSLGGAFTQTNDLINSGSQLNWSFNNNSSYDVTLKSLQLIDGQTGSEGNIMGIDQLVEAGTSVSYTTTIGAAGIHLPVTGRFRYEYNGKEYSVDAKLTNTLGNCTLTIEVTGNGSVTYDGTTIRNGSNSFGLEMLSSATLTFTPDAGYQLVSLKVGNFDMTSEVTNNKYTVSNIISNTTVIVEFGGAIKALTHEGVNYTVVSIPDKTVTVAKGSYGQVLAVPATFKEQDITWNVTGMDTGALKDSKNLAAVIWEPAVAFTSEVSNPNLLLYVTAAEYAPSSIKNVVVNDVAASITLTDATEGNDFYCPQEFTAQRITYSHYYGMTTGIHESRGWETIALPFDVEQITHSSKGTLVPFMNWNSSGVTKPFWLYEYGAGGFRQATAIRANTPYIISMPNNDQYLAEYRVNGTVTFSAENVKVQKTEDIQMAINGDYTFVPNFMKQDASSICYALNVNNSIVTNNSSTAGSMFVRNSRAVYPFEAYMTTQTSNAKPYIAVFEDVPTGIRDIEFLKDQVQSNDAWYTLEGQKLIGTPEKKGVYIHNGKKTIVR